MNVERRQAAADRPLDQAKRLGLLVRLVGCQTLYPPLPFIIITQPES